MAKRCIPSPHEHFNIVEFKDACNNTDKTNNSYISDSDFESAFSTFSDSSDEEEDDIKSIDNCIASCSPVNLILNILII